MPRCRVLLVLAMTAQSAIAEVIYVDRRADGADTGQNWLDAYVDLQSALARAERGDEIWVARGKYFPTMGGDRNATFTLVDGVGLYGGFVGREAGRKQRDADRNVTVLSGNIGLHRNEYDNVYVVVTSIGTGELTVFDGFTITASYNNRQEQLGRGGGLYAEDSRMNIGDCVFEACYAGGGSAIWHERSHTTVRGTVFRNNTQRAITDNNGSNVTYIQCLFEGNSTYADGAAIGAFGGSAPTTIQCVFRRNTVDRDGGAYYGSGDAVFEQCVFWGNRSGHAGGAVYARDGSARFNNCTFYGNHSDALVGGLASASFSDVVTVTNSIFWGNSAVGGTPEEQQIFLRDIDTVDYSCVQFWSGKYGGEGNHGLDPRFVDADCGNLRLTDGSPCIDAGDNGAIDQPFDLDGNPRILHEIVDMGAYESVCHDLDRLSTRCRDNGKLIAKVFTGLPEGSTVYLRLDDEGMVPAAIGPSGRGRAIWKDRSGPVTVCATGCPDACRQADCP